MITRAFGDPSIAELSAGCASEFIASLRSILSLTVLSDD